MLRTILLIPIVGIALGSGSAAAQQPQTLQANTPIQRALAPKDTAHDYTLKASGNQALTVTVDQQGIDVVVTVLGPDGKQVIQVDRASEDQGTGGSEVALVMALIPGEYHVRVSPFDRPDAKPGKYTITLSAVRSMTVDEQTNAKSEAEIAGIEQRWEEAIDRFDVATLSQTLRNDGFALGPTAAATRTREDVIAGWQDNVKQRATQGLTQQHTISEHVIKVAGNTAVSTGRFLMTFTTKDPGQTRFSGQFVHVWARNDQGWKLVVDYTFPFGRVPREQTNAPSLSPAVLSSYAGTYRLESGSGAVSFAVENGALTSQFVNALGPPSPKMPLTALSETTFDGLNGDEVTFVRGPNGDVRELIIVGEGPASRAIRVN